MDVPRSGLKPVLGDWPAAVLALVFSAFVVVGSAFNATDTSEWITGSPAAMVAAFFTFLGLAAGLFVVLKLIFRSLDARWDRHDASPLPAPGFRAAFRSVFLPVWLVILVGWLPWLVIHYPGNVDSDTITQMFQWLGLSAKTNHHPWFDTMVFGWFWDLGHLMGAYIYGLFIALLLHTLLTAAGFAFAFAYLTGLGMGRRSRWVLVAFTALAPALMTAPSVLSKDSFSGIFFVPFLVLFVEGLRTRCRVFMRPWVAVGTICLVIPLVLSKRVNVFLVLLLVIILLIVAARGTRIKLLAGTILVVAITNVVWPSLVLPAMGVAEATSTDLYSLPVQQTARVVKTYGHELPAAEKAAIDGMLRYDGLAEAYTPRRSDAVKGRWKADAPTPVKLAYFKTWLAEGLRYPGTYLAATINNTYEYFAPLTSVNFGDRLVLDRYIDFWTSRAYKTTTREQIAEVANSLRAPQSFVAAQETANHYLKTVKDMGGMLFSKALFASWIPLTVLVFAMRRRSAFLIFATVPLLISLAMLVASPIALPRYVLPSIYGSIVLAGLALTPVRWQSRKPEAAPSRPSE